MTTQTESEQSAIQQLRDRADQANDLEDAVAAQAREIAFLKAGVDTETPLGQLIYNGYNGELVTEDIQTFQNSLGAPLPPTNATTSADTPSEPAPPESPAEALNQIAQSAAPSTISAPDLLEEGFAVFNQRQKEGVNRTDAAAEVINRMIHGAVQEQNGTQGFDGFIYDRERFQER